MEYKSIFLSDLHLSYSYGEAEKLFKFLKEVEAQQIFLLGDIVSHKGDIQNDPLLDRFMEIINSKSWEVIYLYGNNEKYIVQREPNILEKIPLVEEYIYKTENHSIYLSHGDSYDLKTLFRYKIRKISTALFSSTNKCSKKVFIKRRIYYFLKDTIKYLFYHSYKRHMVSLAKKRGCDVVICGHFHIADDKKISGVRYLNCGDWIKHCSYVVEDSHGALKLVNYL